MTTLSSRLLKSSLLPLLSAVVILLSWARAAETSAARPITICNPFDLSYRFMLKLPSYREAADPTIIFFHGEYWLFASKSGGYWHSPDFVHWTFVEPTGLPIESWAPTVETINDHLYFATTRSGIYTTDDPAQGHWTLVSKDLDVGHDADLFLDDDGRLYLYTGCSSTRPIGGAELDMKNFFKPMAPLLPLIVSDPLHRGWEASRTEWDGSPTLSSPSDPAKDTAGSPLRPYIEGSWMNKINGRYYLQYASPATENATYGDGVFVSDHPLGPFVYQNYSPFSFKPTGFTRGAGHGSTFKDAKGNYWHVATIMLSRRDKFERRIGVYPVKIFPDGQMACNTYLGDYPQYPPGSVTGSFESNSPGWMLLSLNKPVKASSELPDHPAALAVDEDMRKWWAAATRNSGEWFQVDLQSKCRIEAFQLDFADEGSHQVGRLRSDAYQYLVEVSDDGVAWKTALDRKANVQDAPTDYAQLDAPVMGRYVRVTNFHAPAGALFSLSGLRVFGNALGALPDQTKEITAQRDPKDDRSVHVSWVKSSRAEFYIVRYGIKPDRLFSNFQVYDATHLDIPVLNSGTPYFVTVDAINGSGITPGPKAVSAD